MTKLSCCCSDRANRENPETTGKISQLNELKRTGRYTLQSVVPPSDVSGHIDCND